MVFGADIENDVLIAIITSVTTILVVTLPIMLQNRQTNRKVEQIYKRVNGVEGVTPDTPKDAG